jgi:hypothetical protein
MDTFEGVVLRGPKGWVDCGCISTDEMEQKAINYLEVGVLHGSNLLQVIDMLLKHPLSKAYAVDPWIDYDGYSVTAGLGRPEYDNQTNFSLCMDNIRNHATAMGAPNMHNDKLEIIRDYSDNALPRFQDGFFDLVYIDGNHDTEFVYNDATNALPKVKSGGLIIFDDASWGTVAAGIGKFVKENADKIVHIGKVRDNEQSIYRKTH